MEEPTAIENGIALHGWEITSIKTHMMESRCSCAEDKKFSSSFSYPLPGEVFPHNTINLRHKAGLTISFSAFEALACVPKDSHGVKVAHAADWLAARPSSRQLTAVKPYDWTYTTNYRGTLASGGARIDLESLKVQEIIHFYDDVYLFADDFGDNGACSTHVRVCQRVMPSGFFVLLREFVRVDKVLVRIRDTRFHHRFEWPYVLREYCEKESSFADLLAALRPMHLDERALFQLDKEPLVVELLKCQAETIDLIPLTA